MSNVPLPSFLQIEPVGRCNLACRMCPVALRPDGHGSHALIQFDTFTRLLDGFTTIKELHLQGLGEPMMHPRFFDMVRYAVARGVRVSTNTNMTLVTPVRAREIVASGLAEISVSLDAANAEVYEWIRVGANFRKVIRNLQRVLDERAAQNASHPHIRIVMVLMRRNLYELCDMVQLAARMKVDGIFVQQLCHDFAESSLPVYYRSMRDFIEVEALNESDAGEVEHVFASARVLAGELGVPLRLPRTRKRPQPTSGPRCDWPWRGAYLSYKSESMPCCMVATPDRAQLGNMATDGVEAIWNGPAYARFRAALQSGVPPEICRTCSVYHGTF
jgi:MoaA/NifB/PqqE/SkfB family radical SAM enzyme